MQVGKLVLRSFVFRFSVAGILLLLASCSNLSMRNLTVVEIANDVSIDLAIEGSLPGNRVVTQKVIATHNGEEHQLLAQIEIENDTLTMVGLSALGNRLFSVIYANGELTQQSSPLIIRTIAAEYMLADFLLCYWSIDLLETRLAATTLRVQQDLFENGKRTFYRGDFYPGAKAVIEIDYQYKDPWQGRVTYHHIERDYTLVIETLAVEAL